MSRILKFLPDVVAGSADGFTGLLRPGGRGANQRGDADRYGEISCAHIGVYRKAAHPGDNHFIDGRVNGGGPPSTGLGSQPSPRDEGCAQQACASCPHDRYLPLLLLLRPFILAALEGVIVLGVALSHVVKILG